MKLTVTESVSLDGVMQGLGGPDEDRRAGFERGGWQVPLSDEEVNAFLNDAYARSETSLFGRRTYEIFAGHRPGRSARSGRHPNHAQRGDDPGLPAQRPTGLRNVHRERKLATKLGVEQFGL